jgi:hypothetical protein
MEKKVFGKCALLEVTMVVSNLSSFVAAVWSAYIHMIATTQSVALEL